MEIRINRIKDHDSTLNLNLTRNRNRNLTLAPYSREQQRDERIKSKITIKSKTRVLQEPLKIKRLRLRGLFYFLHLPCVISVPTR